MFSQRAAFLGGESALPEFSEIVPDGVFRAKRDRRERDGKPSKMPLTEFQMCNFDFEYPGGPKDRQTFRQSSSRRAKDTFANHHNEAVVWAVVAGAIVFCPLHFSAKKVGGGIGAGGINVIVFEKVAHLDPIDRFDLEDVRCR